MLRLLSASAIIFASTFSATAQNSTPQDLPPVFQASLPFVSLKDAQPTLDSFERSLRHEPRNKTGFIYVYGGRSSCPNEAEKIARSFVEYIFNEREIDPPRIIIVNAGFRDVAAFDLFVLLPKSKELTPTPTVDKKDVKLLKNGNPKCKQLKKALLKKEGA